MSVLLIGVLRALVEVALLALLGQGLLGLLAGPSRQHNAVWQLLRLIASPAVRLLRWLLPAAILDRHIPVLTFLTLLWLWLLLAWWRQSL